LIDRRESRPRGSPLATNLNAALAKTRILLDGRNILPLDTDRVFGRRTKAAVERFQRDYKLKRIDGKVGDETRNARVLSVSLREIRPG
jgi:peptidoglycan hydrolase-like protein with peptidoglycan-binding domain